ncbi:nSTAND1 domain-containing NTPase [Nocardia takedensis]|uniref:nSTAND1 domain-containing NTPase n=1 Tax=Nocardia takedensis TaxID=259390 RepID=UPI0012F6CA2F|nr:ATP-binding protein [Nocardia takedensis]
MASNTDNRTGSARAEFARALTVLWKAAGEPTGAAVERAAKAVESSSGDVRRHFGNWKSGVHLPHTYEAVSPVIRALIASAQRSGTLPAEFAETRVWRQRWERADAEKRGARTGDSSKKSVQKSPARDSPYRGLLSYRREDSEIFRGRDTTITAVIDRMAVEPDGPAIIVVSGVSGAGKSSLLHAGVLPRIRKVGLPGAAGATGWPQITVTPGLHPLENLATYSAAALNRSAAALRQEIVNAPADFALTVAAAAATVPRASTTTGLMVGC